MKIKEERKNITSLTEFRHQMRSGDLLNGNDFCTLSSDDGISSEGRKKFREHLLTLSGNRSSPLQICNENFG